MNAAIILPFAVVAFSAVILALIIAGLRQALSGWREPSVAGIGDDIADDSYLATLGGEQTPLERRLTLVEFTPVAIDDDDAVVVFDRQRAGA